MTDQENKEQVSPVEAIVKTYLEKGNGNPASAVTILGSEILNNARETKENPDETIKEAFLKLRMKALIAYGSSASALYSCKQTGGLALAVTELYEWFLKNPDGGELWKSNVGLRSVQRDYLGLVDSRAGR